MAAQITPEQGLFLLHSMFLPALKNEHRITTKVLEAVPVDKPDYRPDAHSRSALDLASHIAIAENRFLDGVACGAFNFASGKPESVKTTKDVSAWYAAEFEKNARRIEKMSCEQLAKAIDFRGIFQIPAVAFLQVTMHHSVHHRGQLCAYLRAMGGKVPSVYGESYDDAEAKKAAQAAAKD
jgi:uncharacterized damage-inducible protein DinB